VRGAASSAGLTLSLGWLPLARDGPSFARVLSMLRRDEDQAEAEAEAEAEDEDGDIMKGGFGHDIPVVRGGEPDEPGEPSEPGSSATSSSMASPAGGTADRVS